MNDDALFLFSDVLEYDNKTCFKLFYKKEEYDIISPMLGIFNVYNLVCSIAIIVSLGIDLEDVLKYICRISIPKGRMNVINYGQNFTVILDYAHTTYATSEVLKFVNKVKRGNIITVVGCAGGRYKEKRKEIGKIVSEESDIAIFTMDDPRYEKIEDIFKDMLEDVETDNVLTIKNRKKAIKKAFALASDNDIVLILGKGKDNYMAIKNKHKKYNDYNVIKKILR